MQIEHINQIIHFKSNSQYELASTFMRLQEFYESPFPEIRNNFFTIEQYMDRYAEANGNFTYTQDRSGFNVPSNIVEKFLSLFKNDLIEKEKAFFSEVEKFKKSSNFDKYYIIGTGEDSIIEDHEMCHALWYLDEEYRDEAMNLISKLPDDLILTMNNYLTDRGYANEVHIDEMNAYLSTDPIIDLTARLNTRELPWNEIVPLHILFHDHKNKEK